MPGVKIVALRAFKRKVQEGEMYKSYDLRGKLGFLQDEVTRAVMAYDDGDLKLLTRALLEAELAIRIVLTTINKESRA